MNDMKLGRLEKLNLKTDLRTYWNKEATDFTPWLAKEENIQLLSEEIGIELELPSLEVSVGHFRADILCKDTNGNNVLIENQLEETDHDHLGQLMTYAAGLGAITIIWIAKKFTKEHKDAVNWLNSITDDKFNFFGIEIELYKIGDSIAAPVFNIVSKPKDWTKQVKESTLSQPATETALLQKEYWQRLKKFMEGEKSFVKIQNPPLKHWVKIAIGNSNFYLTASVKSRSDSSIIIALNFMGDQAKTNYDKLYETSFEKSLTEISQDLKWNKKEDSIASTITLKKSANYLDKTEWPKQFEWFKEYLEKYMTCFKEEIAKFKKPRKHK